MEAFAGCTSLTNVTLPDGVTGIGFAAFGSCSSLASINLPKSAANIQEFVFSGCTNLAAITVDPLNPAFACLGGVLFDASLNTLVYYPGGKFGGYTIPNSVTNIRETAFGDCTRLTEITIPSSVASIADNAFLDCSNLMSLYFIGAAPRVTSISFCDDSGATAYYLPGTTGWGPSLGGIPTLLWNPHIEVNDGSFGVGTNQFGFTVSGTSNLTVAVEVCTNLTGAAWSPLSTNTLNGGSAYFGDVQWTNHPVRFYRLRWP
jgi:hypothetical protein